MTIGHTTGPRIGSVCTGYGGLDLAVELVIGGRLAWYAETDRHASTVLAHRWPDAPNLGDIRTVDWTRVEPVDILTAGFPCQDISNAGRRVGITGEHSSVWKHVATAVRVLRPPLLFVENVAALLRRGLDVVHTDLAEIGYDRSIVQVAKDFDLTETAVREWVKQADIDAGTRSDGLTSVERDELARLRQENRRLREDVDILKPGNTPAPSTHVWPSATRYACRSEAGASAGTTPSPSRSSPPSKPNYSTGGPGPPAPPPARRSSTGLKAGTTPAAGIPPWAT